MHSTIGLTLIASVLAVASANPISARATNAKASMTLLTGKCGSGTKGFQSHIDMAAGGKTGCMVVKDSFQAIILEGQYLGYKVWSDDKCTKQLEVTKEVGKDGCYNFKEGKGVAYSYTS